MSTRWEKGYTQAELDDAQQRFGLVFPPDLVALLRDRRPVEGHVWSDETAIRRALAWPFEGLLFDVEQNHLWWPEWGTRPASPNARAEILRSVVSAAPKLIPLIAHRYLPEKPNEQGNPVFSVYQSDVIYYGANLVDYFEREFLGFNHRPWTEPTKHIPFWSDLVKRNFNPDFRKGPRFNPRGNDE
jgi:hypothetical protein